MKILQKLLGKLNAASRCDLLYRICRVGMHLTPWRTDNSCLPGGLESLHAIVPDCGGSCVRAENGDKPPVDCDVEVIVPCYNVERWVKACVDSILAQETRFRFFVTIVNDGSTDGTRSVLKQYEGHPLVRIIDQENRGFSGARNAGLDQRHGRYIMFVDSDDLLLPGAIEALMTMAEKTGADIVDSAHIRFADDTVHSLGNCLYRLLYNSLQRPQGLPRSENAPSVTGYPCGKAFKTSLFRQVRFPAGYWFEDTLVWMVLEARGSRKAVTDAVTFRYRMNPQSISHVAHQSPKVLHGLYVTLRLLEDREKLGIRFDQAQYEMLVQQLLNNFNRAMSGSISDKALRTVFAIQRDLLCQRFPTWRCRNGERRLIEDFLRADDYDGFRLYAKWH